jgi:hypothetical protein
LLDDPVTPAASAGLPEGGHQNEGKARETSPILLYFYTVVWGLY